MCTKMKWDNLTHSSLSIICCKVMSLIYTRLTHYSHSFLCYNVQRKSFLLIRYGLCIWLRQTTRDRMVPGLCSELLMRLSYLAYGDIKNVDPRVNRTQDLLSWDSVVTTRPGPFLSKLARFGKRRTTYLIQKT